MNITEFHEVTLDHLISNFGNLSWGKQGEGAGLYSGIRSEKNCSKKKKQ